VVACFMGDFDFVESIVHTRQEGIEPPTCRFGDGCSAN
jgi:hypothetical protein